MTSRVRTLAGLGLAAGLAACASPPPGAQLDPRLPTEIYRAEVEDEPHEVALAVHGWGLSQNQAAALADFAAGWHATGGALIHIHVPTAGEPATARRFGEMVRDELSDQGVPDGAMQMVESGEAGVLRVGYVRRVAVVPECGVQWSDLRKSATNQVQPNFGCAVTANMAAMIENPRDIDRPRDLAPADAGRRTVVIDAYRQGEATGAQGGPQARASQVVP